MQIREAHDVLCDSFARMDYDARYASIAAQWEEYQNGVWCESGRDENASTSDAGQSHDADVYEPTAFTFGTTFNTNGFNATCADEVEDHTRNQQPGWNWHGPATEEAICRRVTYSYTLCGHPETRSLRHVFYCSIALSGKKAKLCSDVEEQEANLPGWCAKCMLDPTRFVTEKLRALLMGSRKK